MTKRPIKKRLTRAESAEQTRDLLLEAARQAFVKHGYQAATIDRIAAEAGFTKGAVYWHFENKEALFLELLSSDFDRHIARVDGLLKLAQDAPDELSARIAEWIDAIDERHSSPLLALELELESRRNPALSATFNAIIKKHHAALARVITKWFELSGEEPDLPPLELAATFLILAEGFALARQTRKNWKMRSGKAVRALLKMPDPGARSAPARKRRPAKA